MHRRAALQFLAGGLASLPALAGLSLVERVAFAGELQTRLRQGGALRVLDAHQNETVLSVADLILPETDTPGAKAVKVNEFIDLLLAQSLLEKDRDALLAGLGAIDARARAAHGADFIALNEAQQVALLQALDEAALGRSRTSATSAQSATGETSAERAFATLKELTLYGYFTSEAVMKNILQTPIVPGKFDGCVPVHSV